MRVVADIAHPDLKITLLSMNNKYLIKFEKGNFEQTYKLNEMDVTGEDAVKSLIDDDFVEAVLNRFNDMRDAFVSAKRRHD